jgi:hypothetical protein
MYPHNSSIDDMEDVTPEWYEPFPEPQPFPSGWDLSEVLAVSAAVAKEKANDRVEA